MGEKLVAHLRAQEAQLVEQLQVALVQERGPVWAAGLAPVFLSVVVVVYLVVVYLVVVVEVVVYLVVVLVVVGPW